MRKFFSELIPTTPYWPMAQQEEDIQVIPINSELEAVLTSDDNHPQYGSQEQPSKALSWGVKIQNALIGLENKTEPLKSDFSKWTCFSICNAALASLVPPATYVILSKLNDYVSYPVTHTPELIRLTSQLQNILPDFESIQRAYHSLSHEVNSRFWSLIKIQGAEHRGSSFLLNNCFWQQCHPMYPNDNFTFPAEFKNNHLGCGSDAPDLLWKSDLRGSKYTGLICDYFSIHSLSETNRTPSFEYCQSNLYSMCKNLTDLKQILPKYESLSTRVQQLEIEIDTQGGNYNLISKGVFWGVLIPVTLLSTACLLCLGYSIYKNRQELKTKMDCILNKPLQLNEQETKDIGEILDYLNQIMPDANSLALAQNASIVTRGLNDRGRILDNYFHFFKFSGGILPKELTKHIIEHISAPDISTGDKKPALTM